MAGGTDSSQRARQQTLDAALDSRRSDWPNCCRGDAGGGSLAQPRRAVVDEQADRVLRCAIPREPTENEMIFRAGNGTPTRWPMDDFATVLHHRMETHAPDDVLAAIATAG